MLRKQRVSALLDELERELRALALWETVSPSPAALASQLPFAVDTLAFHQWLQFIYLARLRAMLLLDQPLPDAVSVYPMATEVYKSTLVEHRALLGVIARLDETLSGRPVEGEA